MITIALCMSLAGDPISAVHLYNPVDQPVMVEVELPTGSDTAHIVLLNADGGVLAGPERIESGVSALDLLQIGRLDFQAPDDSRFPCLQLARQSAENGGTAPAMLNAATGSSTR